MSKITMGDILNMTADKLIQRIDQREAELQMGSWHHPGCRKMRYDIQSSPCTCESEYQREKAEWQHTADLQKQTYDDEVALLKAQYGELVEAVGDDMSKITREFWKWWEKYQIDEAGGSTTVPEDAYRAGYTQREAEFAELVEAAVLYVGDGSGARAMDNADWIRFRDAVRVFTKLSPADRLDAWITQAEKGCIQPFHELRAIATELREKHDGN